MRRREFIALLGGLATAPLVAKAQQAEKPYRLGILSPERPPPELLEAFQQGLRELGYVEGKNVAFEIRNSEGDGQELAALASQLVGLKVDVILAVNTPGALAARNATTTIPIVITRVADPLESGLVSSLSRPGGNITGLSFMSTDISGKRLALLKEMLPSVSRVAALWDQRNPGASMIVDAMKAPSRQLGLELLLLPIQGPSDLIGAFQTAKSGRVEALTVVDDVVITSHRIEILSLAEKDRLPVVSQYKALAEAGALMAYGPSTHAIYQRAAYYVDRILKGAKPGDLPVEQPSKFDLVINLKTAKTLGLEIPASLLARADEVIE